MADFLPSNSVSSVCVCVCSIFVRYCAHFRGLQQLCKAVSVDIASMEERFLHSLRYTLINLLKPARPVSSTLTHQEKKEKARQLRIQPGFSPWMPVENHSSPHSWQFSVRVCRNAYKIEDKHTPHHFPWWMLGRGGGCHEGVMKPPTTIRVVGLNCLPTG